VTARPAVRKLLAVVGASIGSLSLAARGGGSGGTVTAAEASNSSGTLSHVHGLGVDPADGRVYVATHILQPAWRERRRLRREEPTASTLEPASRGGHLAVAAHALSPGGPGTARGERQAR